MFRYPSAFITNEFRKFFFEYISTCPFSSFIDDEKQFFTMRTKILGEPTARQSQVASSATTADMDNDQTDDQIMKQQATTAVKPTNYGDKVFVYYTHEQRLDKLKKDMHRVYEDIFHHTPAMYTTIIVGTKNRRDAKNELIRKRPKQSLLQNKTKPSKCHSNISLFKDFDERHSNAFLFLLNRTTKENQTDTHTYCNPKMIKIRD